MFEKMCEHSNGWRPEDGVPDLAMMSDITAEGINVNLRTRYERNQIYTFSGSILIAVNPYKQLDIYNAQAIARYRNQKLDQTDPHVFALAEAMYMNLVMQDLSQPAEESLIEDTEIHEHESNTDIGRFINKKPSEQQSPIQNGKNQACVISGESGAGKTETTKFILSYLCSVTPNKSSWMEHQILEANTILEAFGNAKTIRNDNSSRFGKFIQICFDSHYQINGCIIQDYLLEQSRITYQSIGERNYHVFYQLLSAGQTNQDLRKKFHLMPANFYEYLNKTQCYTVDGVNDCAMFDTLRMAMSVLNMEQENCDGLFSVLSAILWLGNMQFQCDESSQDEQCLLTENDTEIIKIVAELLGVQKEKLEPILLRRQINVRGSITEIPFKITEARDNLNGMAKALYSRLFTWVVNFINASTNPGLENTCFLGILDIFGFENFDTNSFEQLCINYANEKLHKFFNHHMFAMEQELYQREGINFCDINYTDNTPCLELLERPPNCILRLLSEECRMPKGSDITFIEKLHTEFSSTNPHSFYIKGSDRRNWSSEFGVKHFAGTVTYNVKGFLKKNKDAQQTQLLDIIEASTNTLLRDLVNCHGGRHRIDSSCQTGSRSSSFQQDSFDSSSNLESFKSQLQRKKSFCTSTLPSSSALNSAKVRRESSFNLDNAPSRGTLTTPHTSPSSRPTVADTFRHQLASLVELLNSVNPWYVRCIKPNLEKSATDYDDRQVLMQLKYLGMSDLIKIRREGYPIHLTKHQFVCRYRCLLLKHLRSNPGVSPIRLDEKSLESYCIRMINYFQLDSEDWKIGKTMVLLRTNIYQPMEEKRNRLFIDMATLIQSVWRGFVQKREFLKEREAATRIQEKFRAYRGRLLYLRKKRAVLTIQAYVRGMFAREIAGALREIKRVELEKAKKAALEEDLRERERKLLEEKKAEEENSLKQQIASDQVPVLNICAPTDNERPQAASDGQEVEDDKDKTKSMLTCNTETSTPLSNVSPAVSSSTSWIGQDTNSETRPVNNKDLREMDQLVKVLERHGISLETAEQNGEAVYADLERLYDVLGNQMQSNCDTQSLSPSVNEDDKCSLTTVEATCDTVSYSGQSQISSTVTDENTAHDEKAGSDQSNDHLTSSNRDATINQDQDRNALAIDGNYQSNSTESIASIVSSTSLQANPINQITGPDQLNETQVAQVSEDIKHALENQPRTSTFTGNSIVVGGSKLISNGRPLTSIEEEPNSTATSPSKTPNKKPSRPPSLFPPDDDTSVKSDIHSSTCNETKKRRLERKILQVQQEQNLHQINPTTAGLPVCNQNNVSYPSNRTGQQPLSLEETTDNNNNVEDDVYGQYKCNMMEFAESSFNDHFRENTNNGVLRTLTRRRKSVETGATMYLSKGEMLSYNSSFTIPSSHIRMHDPHNSRISCSMFKNLCKYMTGESSKSDTEIRIIQSIIRHGIEKSELRDEIYVQIIRQLTNNPNHEFCLRLWVLFGLVSAAFSPSKSFSKYLITYLRSKPRKDPSITCHAQFCLDNLQTPRINPRKYPPSPLEIQACKNLTNLTCKIHLLDGRSETIGLHPCDTAFDALTKLAQRIGLQSTEGWALYESYTSGSSKYPHPSYEMEGDFERSVRAHYFMADLIACWQDEVGKSGSSISIRLAQKRLNEGNFKLTMKKRIFRGPKIRRDPLEICLLYAQAVYNVVRKDSLLVDELLALSLAGLQAQITLGNAVDLGKVDHQSKKGKASKGTKLVYKPPHLVYEVETYICQRLRNQTTRSKKEWCMLIAQEHRQCHGVNEVYCKMRYLSLVICRCPLYGTATFKVLYKDYQTLDQNLLLGINSEGLLLIRPTDRMLVNGYKYIDICNDVTVYVEEKILQFTVKDRSNETFKCLSFEASECEEIAVLMSSYTSSLNISVRGGALGSTLDPKFDQSALKKRPRLKMTLEDRMRIHQEVQNTRKAIIKSGKLRKPIIEENPTKLLRHTLKRLASSKTKIEKPTRFESVYGTLGKVKTGKPVSDIPQASSDYNIYGSNDVAPSSEVDSNQSPTELAEVTANTSVDELTKAFPHRYWAYTKTSLKNSLLIIYDSDLEDAALVNFNAILTYSGLLNDPNSNSSTLDSSSIDSGIASQQSLSNLNNKVSGSSPSSTSSGDIYDVCPKKIDERELLRLAQGILDRCLRKDADILKNEFFLQLIKQTTDHPDPNSEINQRHWQLLALACSITFPSDGKILSYLYAHLRRCSLDQVTDEGQFAQFTLRSLQGTLETKGRLHAPSEIEILSTINCRRVYARVYLLDGQFHLVEFDPCATIAEVVEQIKRKLGLRPDCVGYALFQPLDEECEQVLQPEEKVGDAIAIWESWQKQKIKCEQRNQQDQRHNTVSSNGIKPSGKESFASLNAAPKSRTHRFIFKKYLFLESLQDANDPVERELMYCQTVASIKEDKFPALGQEAATILCAIKSQIEVGDYTKLCNLPREHIRMFYKQVIMSLMPPHSFNNLPIPAIAQQHQAFRDLSCADAKKYFFNLIQSFGRANLSTKPGFVLLHRAHVYEASPTSHSAWDQRVWIAVNQFGVHFLKIKSRDVLGSCSYDDVSEYNSNNNYLIIILMVETKPNPTKIIYTFYTRQAQQIAQQMKDYIVIGKSGGTKHRKSVEFNLRPTSKQLETQRYIK